MLRAVAAAGLALSAGGCGLLSRSSVKLRGYDLAAAPHANQDSPVRVDVVVVRDPALAETVAKLTAAGWFAQRGQLVLDNPRMLEITSLEPVPGQALPWSRVQAGKKAHAAFVFADYAAEGDHRVRVDPYRWITIRLEEEGMAVEGSRGP